MLPGWEFTKVYGGFFKICYEKILFKYFHSSVLRTKRHFMSERIFLYGNTHKIFFRLFILARVFPQNITMWNNLILLMKSLDIRKWTVSGGPFVDDKRGGLGEEDIMTACALLGVWFVTNSTSVCTRTTE